jgi:hypothetical protein
MKRLTWLILLLLLPWLISACGKGKETATHKEGVKHEAKKVELVKSPFPEVTGRPIRRLALCRYL